MGRVGEVPDRYLSAEQRPVARPPTQLVLSHAANLQRSGSVRTRIPIVVTAAIAPA